MYNVNIMNKKQQNYTKQTIELYNINNRIISYKHQKTIELLPKQQNNTSFMTEI